MKISKNSGNWPKSRRPRPCIVFWPQNLRCDQAAARNDLILPPGRDEVGREGWTRIGERRKGGEDKQPWTQIKGENDGLRSKQKNKGKTDTLEDV